MKIALIVGHNQTLQGAINYLGESEFQFNLKVCQYIYENSNKENISVFLKDADYVERINDYHPDLIVELHFNAFTTEILGSEALVLKGDDKSQLEAHNLLNKFKDEFDIKVRGIKYLQKYHRGFKNFQGLDHFPMVLFEPCFANFKTKDSTKIMENWKEYAQFFIEYFDKSEKVNDNIMTKMIELIQSWFK